MLDELKNFLQNNNFNHYKKSAYGIYRGRLITIRQRLTTVNVSIAFNRAIGQDLARQVTSRISEIKRNHTALVQGITTNVSLVLHIYQTNDFYNEFKTILDGCLTVLDEAMFPTHEICPVCGMTLSPNDMFLKTRFGVIQLHDNCAKQLMQSADNFTKTQQNNNKKNNFLSILFSIIIQLAFILICAVMAGKNDSLNWTFVLVLQGWASFFIYRLFMTLLKVPVTKVQILSISIASIIGLFISFFISIFMDMHYQLPDYTYLDLIKYFFVILGNSKDYTSDVLINLILSLVILSLNLFSNLMVLKNITGGGFEIIKQNKK